VLPPKNGNPFVSAAWFLRLGGLPAAAAKLSLNMTTALAVLLRAYHGYLSGTGMGPFGIASVALLGLVFGVFVLIALAAAFVVPLRAHWARIAVRVAGSSDHADRFFPQITRLLKLTKAAKIRAV
jgi:urease accessory protein